LALRRGAAGVPAPPLAHLTLRNSQQQSTAGRRETNNASRRFLDPGRQAAEPACAAVAQRFQSPWLIDFWRSLYGVSLDDCVLRIEYCQDVGGFWLEPHTDICVKRFTMLIYLADPPPGEFCGTDLLRQDQTPALRARHRQHGRALHSRARHVAWLCPPSDYRGAAHFDRRLRGAGVARRA
jgi:hypothetical protein